ncbi:MAG: bifunctional pyr operon transcriptional regulator/uracil phosphoribosyltransferase PyrR [Atopobiaceae bacterium]|nr:bifunctional pyr operon transcriptional regulator/uracil phosphoribosyltransferase PyrR [Atopobiaceae bacterium]
MAQESSSSLIVDEQTLDRMLTRIAHEIIENNQKIEDVALVGIIRRGEVLAARIAEKIQSFSGYKPKVGSLDISFYRDDFRRNAAPVLHATNIDFEINGISVVLVDDVLQTGRTIRAALDALIDYGRPERVQLAVVVDRGHRELPIRPDYVGKNIPSSKTQIVSLNVKEVDGQDCVMCYEADFSDPSIEGGK